MRRNQRPRTKHFRRKVTVALGLARAAGTRLDIAVHPCIFISVVAWMAYVCASCCYC
jgi:hypothetical protein